MGRLRERQVNSLPNARNRRRGSQLLEGGLMMLPFLALAFLTLDAGWTIFVKATLLHAVREGVRYGVTGQVSGNNGQAASIEEVVVAQAMGLLSGGQGTLSVQYLDPVSMAPSSNAGGNIVEVSVSYQIAPLAPLLRSSSSIPITVTAADLIEGSPGGIPPKP
jgi:Flp pilus assembly protein TadG